MTSTAAAMSPRARNSVDACRPRVRAALAAPLAALLAVAACADPVQPPATPLRAAPTAPAAGLLPVATPSVGIAQTAVTVTQGGGVLLGAVLLDPRSPWDVVQPITWSSSNPAVASVGPTGQVRAVAPGTATITARVASLDIASTSVVTVVARPNCAGRRRRAVIGPPNSPALPRGPFSATPIMFRLPTADPDPCLRYAFVLTLEPINGRAYQVAEDGTPRMDTPIRLGDRVLNSEGWVAFRSNAGFWGDTGLDYLVLDDLGRRLAPPDGKPPIRRFLPITVSRVNQPPVARGATYEGTNVLRSLNVVLKASDADGDPTAFCFATLPANGTLYWGRVHPDDRVVVGDCRRSQSLQYQRRPEPLFGCGPPESPSTFPRTETFSFVASDGRAISDTVSSRIVVTYENEPPVFAGPERVATTEGGGVEFRPEFVDPDGDRVLIFVPAPPAHGVLYQVVNGELRDPYVNYPLLLSPGTVLKYVPNPDFNTLTEGDQIRLQGADASGASRDCPYAVQFDVAAVNTAPVIDAPARAGADAVSGTFTGTRIRDDARPGDALLLTVRAEGPAAGGIDFTNAGGLPVQRVSATEVRVEGTLAQLNTLLAAGVVFLTAPNGQTEGTVVFVVDDRGSFGAGGRQVTTRTVVMDISTDTVTPLTP